MTYSRALVRPTDGAFTISDPTDRNIGQVVWTSFAGGGLQAQAGEQVYDPNLGQKTTLLDEPEYADVTITTAYSDYYAVVIENWRKLRSQATNIVGVGRRGGLRYDVKGCSIRSISGLGPEFDKNGSGTTAATITIVLKPTSVSRG